MKKEERPWEEGAHNLSSEGIIEQGEEKVKKIFEFLEQGLPLIPVNAGSKEPLKDWQTPYDCSKWTDYLKKNPNCNYALLLGENYCALDLDSKDASTVPSYWLQTALIETPRGYKAIFSAPFSLSSFTITENLEFHGKGKFALLPPSYTSNGVYNWLTSLKDMEMIPSDLLEIAQEKKRTSGRSEVLGWVKFCPADCIRQIIVFLNEGNRNKGFYVLAELLKQDKNFKNEHILKLLLELRKEFTHDFTEGEVKSIVASVFKKDYALSCAGVKRYFPQINCSNCVIAQRRIKKLFERERFILKAQEEFKGDGSTIAIAVNLATLGLYGEKKINYSRVEKESGFSHSTVSRALKKLRNAGLLPTSDAEF